MTSYIPSLTLPASIFAQPAASILLPVAMSGMVGYACRRKSSPRNDRAIPRPRRAALTTRAASETQKTYMALKQPPLRPPPWVFGPTWTVLYMLMGYGAYHAWTTGTTSFDPSTVELAKVSRIWMMAHRFPGHH
jgi:benzodiazapine receptor